MSTPHIIIIGAGITGLLIAQGLKKSRIPFSIFEAESASLSRSREWTMSMHWAAPLLVDILPENIYTRLKKTFADPFYVGELAVPIYNAKTGEHIITNPQSTGIRVSRQKLRKLLGEDIDVNFGEELIKFEVLDDGVTATFKSGQTCFGSVIIGSDGPNSTVRTLLLGDKGKASRVEGIAMYNFTVKYANAEKARLFRTLHPINKCGLAPDHGFSIFITVQEVKDPEKPEDWTFQLLATWDTSDESHRDLELSGKAGLAKMKEIGEGFAEPWKSMLTSLPDDLELHVNNTSYWVTIPWDNHGGRVTLAGDAAHPMPPHRGQGLNHCVADVGSILKSLQTVAGGNQPLKDVVTVYDEEVVKRGSQEVATSRMSAILLHDFEKFMNAPIFKKGYAKS